MTPENLRHYVDAIHRSRAVYAQGYPSAIHLVARAMLDAGAPASAGPPARVLHLLRVAARVPARGRSSARSARACATATASSEFCVSMTECAEGRLHVDMEFGIVEVEVAEETRGLGARPAARDGPRRTTRRRCSALSRRRRRHALEARLPVRARRRRLPRDRRADRGLRADPGRPPGRPPRPHLQGAARRGRGADPPGDAGGARGARGAGGPSTTRRRSRACSRSSARGSARRSRSSCATSMRSRASRNGKFRAVKSAVGRLAMIRVGLARTSPSYAGHRAAVRPRQGVPRARAACSARTRRPDPPTTSTARSARRCARSASTPSAIGSADWNPLGALAQRGARIVLKPNFIRHWNPVPDGDGRVA